MYLPEPEIDRLVNSLSRGKTVLLPSDTIWGISCDAFNSESVKEVIRLKRSAPDKKFILLVSSLEMLKSCIGDIHPRVQTLLNFYAKPTSCIYPAADTLPKHLVAPEGTVGIRWVREGVILDIIEKFGRPIVSTSANFTGEPFPGSFDDISLGIKEEVDVIPELNFEDQSKKMGQPSVIISYDEDGELIFLRT